MSGIFPVKAEKPKVDKDDLCDAIEKALAQTEIPRQLRYSAWENIVDLPKFLDSHINVIRHDKGRQSRIFGERLRAVLKMLDIDMNEIAKALPTKTEIKKK